MASRRDELNAYTFAKKRLNAAFLQPSQTGTEEGAPRPLRAVLPGMVVGALVLAGFGAWGMFKPKEPEKWDEVGEKVIVGSKSTTRYVVLETDDKKQLHPVLNLASARLLLDAGKGEVVKVDEEILDGGDIPHGATIGIPYGPDRLPEPDEAGADKRWAVCERPGQGGRAIQKAAFVFAERDAQRTEGQRRLSGGELLYVKDRGGQRWAIDSKGVKYPVPEDELLLRTLFRSEQPQRVSNEWLATFREGDEINFPQVPGQVNQRAGASEELGEADRVGMVLRARAGTGYQHYLVLAGRVVPVSDFTAVLLLSKTEQPSGQNGRATTVAPSAIVPGKRAFDAGIDWPTERAVKVNSARATTGARNTVCNVLRKVDEKTGTTTLSTWAGRDFPAQLPTGSTSAYVTPGSGQLFRQIKGSETKAGSVFLATDTGLRYALQANNDSASEDAGIGTDGKQDEQSKQQQAQGSEAQVRLGYENIKPAPIPAAWSQFLPTGPRLGTSAARQPQGS
ncbi:type VII secretion protein EccB [Streptomyces xiaopingdaonensis]|uniref:type VII secretion protein EccB n=1 Tax=Streptomyces xiaopingdaonensis TaxID=1565415 RepID=UPI0002F20CE6|nr:type VII secretion protein EccB [Streptomyces xiaopingdaonensis]